MKQFITLDLNDAKIMIEAAKKKAKEINVFETICVTDNSGVPIIIERMDGARVTGPQISWNKAFTASTHKRSTHFINKTSKTALHYLETKPLVFSLVLR